MGGGQNASHAGLSPLFPPRLPPTPTAGSPSAPSVVAINGYTGSQAVIARPRPCMGYRLARHPQRALGVLPLRKALPRRVATDGPLRGLPSGPRAIRGAMFDVPLALPLPGAAWRPLDPAARRGSVAHRRQAAPRARVQPPRLGHHRPDALAWQQGLVGGRGLSIWRHGLCARFALWAQTVQEGETAGDRQPLVGLGQQALAVVFGARVHRLDTEAPPGMARPEVWHTAHLGRVRPPPGRAFAHALPHGPRGLGGEGPCGQHAQSSHRGQPARRGRGLRILQAALWLHRGRVGQMPPVGRFQPSVDKPVPRRGRLHPHARDGGVIRGEVL
jgi:hypothetical protein